MIFNIIFKYNLKFDIKKLTFMNLVNKDIYVLLPDKGLIGMGGGGIRPPLFFLSCTKKS